MAPHHRKVRERYLDGIFSITYLGYFFHHIIKFYRNSSFTLENQSNAELAFPDILFKRNDQYIFLLVYRKSTDIDQSLHHDSHPQRCCEESVISFLLNRAYCIITNKDDLSK